MAGTCSTCESAPSESRWKGVALMMGAILLCPCHLPATLAGIAALGGAAWVAGNAWIAYLLLSIAYVFVIVIGLYHLMRARDRERDRMDHRAAHATAATSE